MHIRQGNLGNATDPASADSSVNRGDLAVCACLLALAAVLLGKDIAIGGPRGDGAARMMDGVLIYDWVRGGVSAWLDPMAFAVRQYSYYPSLGIGSAYPPGFAAAEAVFFMIFGVSAMTARLCVLTFGLLAVCGVFLLMRKFASRLASSFAVLSLLVMPAVLDWTRQTALETPTLAVLVWSVLAGFHYTSRPNWARLSVWILLTLIERWVGD